MFQQILVWHTRTVQVPMAMLQPPTLRIADTSSSGLLHSLDEYKLASFSTSRGSLIQLIELICLFFNFSWIWQANPVPCIIWQMSNDIIQILVGEDRKNVFFASPEFNQVKMKNEEISVFNSVPWEEDGRHRMNWWAFSMSSANVFFFFYQNAVELTENKEISL